MGWPWISSQFKSKGRIKKEAGGIEVDQKDFKTCKRSSRPNTREEMLQI